MAPSSQGLEPPPDPGRFTYCPKGSSVVLYRDAELRRHQLYAFAAWTGYTVINTTFQSTKSGGALGATWAVLNYLGDDGYLDIADRTLAATRAIVEGIDAMADLQVMGTPESSLVAVTSETVDVFEVVDEMRARRWFVQPQLGFMGSRDNIHLSVGGASLPIVPALLEDLAAAVDVARPKGPKVPDPDLVALLESIDPAALDAETFDSLLAGAGLADGDGSLAVPDRTAGINAILSVCPPPLAERMLIEFFNRIYVPTAESEVR